MPVKIERKQGGGTELEEKIIKRRRELAKCTAVPIWSPFLEGTAS